MPPYVQSGVLSEGCCADQQSVTVFPKTRKAHCCDRNLRTGLDQVRTEFKTAIGGAMAQGEVALSPVV
jgi:hypothetical protein